MNFSNSSSIVTGEGELDRAARARWKVGSWLQMSRVTSTTACYCCWLNRLLATGSEGKEVGQIISKDSLRVGFGFGSDRIVTDNTVWCALLNYDTGWCWHFMPDNRTSRTCTGIRSLRNIIERIWKNMNMKEQAYQIFKLKYIQSSNSLNWDTSHSE